MDVFALCEEVLNCLLNGQTPDVVQKMLAEREVPESDIAHLVNLTIVAAQAASPVIEQRESITNAVQNLVAQGVDEKTAAAMINMVIHVMSARAEAQVKANNAENPSAEIDENTMKVLMRLASAIAVDFQNGGNVEAMIAALRNIEGINDIKEVYDCETEFINNVKLACSAAERAQAIPLPEVLTQLGIDQLPPYVSVLALFFMRLKRGE